ncbi:putative secondary Na+/bile acid symporter, bile acid:Na+ symporter (BASS) family [Corynebacterium imitans]|uniref:Membrane protein n=1 Tax=Corynebacterium imitans TaxID=156978 RepID=A0A076NJ80_9CORY|nr:bile acid:sodium symporter family protein [Corynebacterium imitans]AIJ34514.1 membrane protein [Corynebacterium imitans]SNV52336.1 putative secondary Na+/bile acid symporter, bile acid:Na+ symporter (BASS) family [Corynebacterium imitans]
MPSFLKRLDPLVAGIIVAAILAFIVPARGSFADGFAVAVKLAIALLFFLYGARLSTREALHGLTHWRLHASILCCTFLIYPLIGLALRPLTAVISTELYQGILYMTLVPSTVQSSVALTGIARGNISGAVVAASLSSLVGVVATPVLVMLLMGSGEGLLIDASVFLNIAIQLLLPFLLGQIAHNLSARARVVAKSKATKIVDRGSIWMVVYSAFSTGVVAGVWEELPLWEILFLIVFSAALVLVMLWLTRVVPSTLGFNRADTVAIQQCGTQKSLATGLPMASVMFGGATLGALIIPLMVYHMVQLMVCSTYVSRYAGEDYSDAK